MNRGLLKLYFAAATQAQAASNPFFVFGKDTGGRGAPKWLTVQRAAPNAGNRAVANVREIERLAEALNLGCRLRAPAPYLEMASINGADHNGDWSRLIQTLDRNAYAWACCSASCATLATGALACSI